ncbi:hypothetical protein B0H11DRAFT_1308711 [Mycena galericulata]|nr:hypothetical protein B0H11DRAFT_1308711 [Mycena galericulata]
MGKLSNILFSSTARVYNLRLLLLGTIASAVTLVLLAPRVIRDIPLIPRNIGGSSSLALVDSLVVLNGIFCIVIPIHHSLL